MIQVNSHRPYVEINGVQHVMGRKRARFAEMLLKANGQPVSFEQIMARLSTTKGTVQVYAHSLRRIFEPHGFALVSEFGMGYRLQRLRSPEYALESRAPLKSVTAAGH
jgi:DNA-binding response OmpR family regulator